MFTGVYKISCSPLVPTPSAASAASLAFLAALVAPWLLDAVVPAIMTAACTRPSSPPGAAVQPLVERGYVTHEKTHISLGYASETGSEIHGGDGAIGSTGCAPSPPT